MEKSNHLSPAYLLLGTDEVKVKNALKRMVDRFLEAGGDPDWDRSDLDAAIMADAEATRAALDTIPMMGPFRLVIARDVDEAPKAGQDAITSYLQTPSESTVLLATSSKLAKNTRLYKAFQGVSHDAIVDCSPRKAYELPSEVQGWARAAGRQMGIDAAAHLVELVGESTLLLKNELEKVIRNTPSKSIDADDIDKWVSRTSEVKPWDVCDAICKRDPAKAHELLGLYDEKGFWGLLSLMGTRMHEMLCAAQMVADGRPKEIARELGLPDWKVKNYPAWARNYSPAEIRRAIITLADLEQTLRSSADARGAWIDWAMRTCAR